MELHRPDQAQFFAERAAGLLPQRGLYRGLLGEVLMHLGRFPQAEKAFQEVLKKEPQNLDATIGMGVAVRGLKRFDEAETWYNKAASIDPKNCAISYNLGILYQDYKRGEEDLKKAQGFYNKFTSCGGRDPKAVEDARRRVKDIDDTFKALEEQRKLEAELKKMQELEKQQQQQGGAAPAPEPAK